LGFVRRGAVDVDGQRKTGNRGDGHDFGPLAPLGWTHGQAPFFALAKLPSSKPSCSGSSPRRWSSCASARRAFSSCPLRTHC
jgi:hypothetical protein